MLRPTAAVLGFILLACAGYAQGTPQSMPAGAGPARPMTVQDVLRAAEQAVPRIAELANAGKSAEALRLSTETQRDLDGILQNDPKNLEARITMGELLILLREADKARAMLADVLKEEQGNFRANLALGRYYFDTRCPRQATGYLERAAKAAPPGRQAETLCLLANSLASQGDRTKAINTAEQAVAADPADISSLSTLVDMYIGAQQYEKAIEHAKALIEASRKAHDARLAERAPLERLISSYQTQVKCLVGYYALLCKRDARGRATDQLESGKEAEAVRVLRDIAAAQEESAKLTWELSYHQTLEIVEPVAGYQNEQVRARLESNTDHLLTLAGLYWATHQTDRAVELFRRIAVLANPSDGNPAEARSNQEMAREFLQQHGFAVEQPAGATAQP